MRAAGSRGFAGVWGSCSLAMIQCRPCIRLTRQVVLRSDSDEVKRGTDSLFTLRNPYDCKFKCHSPLARLMDLPRFTLLCVFVNSYCTSESLSTKASIKQL
jgi:hypothetical protein